MIKIEKIGFDVAVTMTDGHSSNMNFFNNKLLKSKSNLFVLMDSGAKNVPFYYNTHIFKNVYNNWSNYDSFECPSFPNIENTHEIISPTFSHLKELYLLEKGRNKKFAYKLTDKVLHPKPIEKTNVKLADAAFHESTTNALRYYSSRGYSHFKPTAIFIQVIRDWFSTINVKSTDYGKRTRDERKNAIHRSTMKLWFIIPLCLL